MGERYRTKLPPKILAKSILQMNEPMSDEGVLEAIDSLRNEFIKLHPDVQLKRNDDLFFLKFLRARKFQEKDALELIRKYHARKDSEFAEIFAKINHPELLVPLLNEGVVCPLKGRGKDGSAIVQMQMGKNDSSLLDNIALLYLTLDFLSEDEQNQINGLIIIHDFCYLTLNSVMQMEKHLLKQLLKMINNSVPIIVRNVLVVNQISLITLAYSAAKQKMKEANKEKVRLIGTKYKLLEEFIDPSVLPPQYGGSGPNCNPSVWVAEILGVDEPIYEYHLALQEMPAKKSSEKSKKISQKKHEENSSCLDSIRSCFGVCNMCGD